VQHNRYAAVAESSFEMREMSGNGMTTIRAVAVVG
jgi:hypothetical protein